MSDIASSLQVTVMTPRGRGAVAVIRVCGIGTPIAQLPLRLAAGRTLAELSLNRIYFGTWGESEREEIVVCRIDEQTLELCCHGGDRAVERILRDWTDAGARVASWQDGISASADLLEAELQECLSRSVTWRTAEWLLRQSDGRLRQTLESLAEVTWSDSARSMARDQIDELLRWSNFGIHLSQPWKVVITGPPNVGKSSLINALLGYQRSIVFDQPGTTRDVVTADTAFDGWPVQLVDTAGLRTAADTLEAQGIERAKQQVAAADLIIELFDISVEPADERMTSQSGLLVAQKCDLPDRWGSQLPASALRVSAQAGIGLEELGREMARRLVPELPSEGMALPVTARQQSLLRTMRQSLSTSDEREYRIALRRLLEQS